MTVGTTDLIEKALKTAHTLESVMILQDAVQDKLTGLLLKMDDKERRVFIQRREEETTENDD